MKRTLTYLSLAAVFGFCAFAKGQSIILTGSVTATSGTYMSQFSVGDPVEFFFDFSKAPADIFGGAALGVAGYIVPAKLTIGSHDLKLYSSLFGIPPVQTTTLFFQNIEDNGSPSGFGITTNVGLVSSDTPGSIIDQGPFKEFHVNFLSHENIIPSLEEFPSGTPLSYFYLASGSYSTSNHSIFLPGDSIGEVDWKITSYTGFGTPVELPPLPPSLTPVPEPATYGVFAALGLVVLTAFKQRRKTARCH